MNFIILEVNHENSKKLREAELIESQVNFYNYRLYISNIMRKF